MLQLKLKIMTDWIRDLGEQNTMLVQIVHDLEQATVDRVKLLENKLQETSNLISHNIISSDKPEEVCYSHVLRVFVLKYSCNNY